MRFLPYNFYTYQKGIVAMFEFKFTEEQNMLREMTREFTDNEIKPIAAKIDKEEKIPDDLIKKLGELGLLGTAFLKNMEAADLEKLDIALHRKKLPVGVWLLQL